MPGLSERVSGFLRGSGLLLACLMASTACLAQMARLSMVTGAAPPLSASAQHPGFLDEVAREAFRRAGIEIDVTAVPTERSLINVNSAIDDGDLFRIAGVEAEYPNLVRIPEKIMDSDFVAYVKRSDLRVRNWVDLQPLVVGYTTGWKIYERRVQGVKEVVATPSISELPLLLEKGRVDAILMDRWQGQWVLRQAGLRAELQEPPLASVEIFMHLHKKHAELVPKVAQALRQMKADGSYRKIYDALLAPLVIR